MSSESDCGKVDRIPGKPKLRNLKTVAQKLWRFIAKTGIASR